MYQKKDDLEHLIKSLTNGEKRYLTNVFKQSPDGALYLSLYDKLQKSKSVMSNCEIQITGRVLIEQKRFLYKTILKHLRQMHSDLSPDVSIQNLLAEVELLYNHSLSQQAMRLLLKAKDLASKHEKFGLYLQILMWEQKLCIVLDHPVRSIEAIRTEEAEIFAKNAQINLLLGFYSEIMLLKKQYGYAKGTVREQLDAKVLFHSSFPSKADCKSNKAKYYYNLILSVYYWMTYDHQRAFQFSQSLLGNDGRDILPSDYINGLLQHITSSVCVAKFDHVLHGIRLTQAFMEQYKLNQSYKYRLLFFSYDSTYKLIVYAYTGDQVRLREVIYNSEHQLDAFREFIPAELYVIILGNIMNAYMAVGDVDRAWAISDQLSYSSSKEFRKDIFADLYLFRVFLLLTKQSYDLLSPTVATALRFFRKTKENKLQFQVEYKIVQLFAKEIDCSKPINLNPLLHQARSILKDYITEVSGTIGFQEHYTRYIIWFDAIEKKIPYYKAARDWYKHYSNVQE